KPSAKAAISLMKGPNNTPATTSPSSARTRSWPVSATAAVGVTDAFDAGLACFRFLLIAAAGDVTATPRRRRFIVHSTTPAPIASATEGNRNRSNHESSMQLM